MIHPSCTSQLDEKVEVQNERVKSIQKLFIIFISNVPKQVPSSNVGSWGFGESCRTMSWVQKKVTNAVVLCMLGDMKWWDTSVLITAQPAGSGHPRAPAFAHMLEHLSKHTCKAPFFRIEAAFYSSLSQHKKKWLIQLNMTNCKQTNKAFIYERQNYLILYTDNPQFNQSSLS